MEIEKENAKENSERMKDSEKVILTVNDEPDLQMRFVRALSYIKKKEALKKKRSMWRKLQDYLVWIEVT